MFITDALKFIVNQHTSVQKFYKIHYNIDMTLNENAQNLLSCKERFKIIVTIMMVIVIQKSTIQSKLKEIIFQS